MYLPVNDGQWVNYCRCSLSAISPPSVEAVIEDTHEEGHTWLFSQKKKRSHMVFFLNYEDFGGWENGFGGGWSTKSIIPILSMMYAVE